MRKIRRISKFLLFFMSMSGSIGYFLCFLVVIGLALGFFIPLAVPDIQRKHQYYAGTCITRITNSSLSLGRDLGPCSRMRYCSGLPCATFPTVQPGTFFCCKDDSGCQIQIVPGTLYVTETSFQGTDVKMQADQFCILANPNCVVVSQPCFTNQVDIRFDAYSLSGNTILVITAFSAICGFVIVPLGCMSWMYYHENKKRFAFDESLPTSDASVTGKIGQLVPLSEIKTRTLE